jgi:hypothetical protein
MKKEELEKSKQNMKNNIITIEVRLNVVYWHFDNVSKKHRFIIPNYWATLDIEEHVLEAVCNNN